MEQIDLIKRFIEQYSSSLHYVTSAGGLVEAHKAGKIASVISVESGHSIGTSLAVLRMYYRLGARSLTLTHNCNNPWADSSLVDKEGNQPVHNGLTSFGKVSPGNHIPVYQQILNLSELHFPFSMRPIISSFVRR